MVVKGKKVLNDSQLNDRRSVDGLTARPRRRCHVFTRIGGWSCISCRTSLTARACSGYILVARYTQRVSVAE